MLYEKQMLNPADMKKQILAHSNREGIRKKLQSEGGLSDNDIVGMGNALENYD